MREEVTYPLFVYLFPKPITYNLFIDNPITQPQIYIILHFH